MTFLQEIKEMLSTWRATAVLLLLLSVAMGAATFLESGLGTEAALSVIYHSWWFFLLFGLLVANFILLSQKLLLNKRRHWGVLLLHYGFTVILLGAFTTHLWGYEGTLRIRIGQSTNQLVTSDGTLHELPFRLALRDFRLVRYPGSNTPSSYESDLTIQEGTQTREVSISMNNIARNGNYRIYQSSYDPDEQGTILSINHDPAGNSITYAGYVLLCGGLIGSIAQRGSRFRMLLSRLENRPQTSALEPNVNKTATPRWDCTVTRNESTTLPKDSRPA